MSSTARWVTHNRNRTNRRLGSRLDWLVAPWILNLESIMKINLPPIQPRHKRSWHSLKVVLIPVLLVSAMHAMNVMIVKWVTGPVRIACLQKFSEIFHTTEMVRRPKMQWCPEQPDMNLLVPTAIYAFLTQSVSKHFLSDFIFYSR